MNLGSISQKTELKNQQLDYFFKIKSLLNIV